MLHYFRLKNWHRMMVPQYCHHSGCEYALILHRHSHSIAGPIPAPELSAIQAGVILAPTPTPATIGLIAAPLGRACTSLR